MRLNVIDRNTGQTHRCGEGVIVGTSGRMRPQCDSDERRPSLPHGPGGSKARVSLQEDEAAPHVDVAKGDA